MNMFILCLGLVLVFTAGADHHLHHHQSERNPKMFFVSSSSTVVTVTSTTFCFYTSMAYNQEINITQCTKRRRRGLSFEGKEKDRIFILHPFCFKANQSWNLSHSQQRLTPVCLMMRKPPLRGEGSSCCTGSPPPPPPHQLC